MFEYGGMHEYSLLCADPRLGKSRVAILLQQLRNVNTLVVCPSHLVTNWKHQINLWNPKASVTTFRKGKEIYDVCDSDFVVISYDLLQKAEHLFEWADQVIADEVHALKNMASKKSAFFHRCLYENSIKYFHGLTGTPLKNRVKEFYSIIALTYYDPRLDDGFKLKDAKGWEDFLKANFKDFLEFTERRKFLEEFPDEITFAEHFSYPEMYEVTVTKGKKSWQMPVTNYKGLRNEKELRFWLKNRYLRIRADKNDLPPITYLDTLVSDIADPLLLKSFNAYFNDERAVKAHAKAANLSDHHARKLRTSSVLPEHKKQAALRKVPFTIKYVENLMESVECCLIYSDHRESCKQLAAHFGVPAITGETSGTKRAQLVNDFQEGRLNIICATIGSLKEGSDIYRADDTVLNDLCWVPGDIQQVINRMRKLGQKNPKTVHRIFGSPQDEKISIVLEEKMKVIDSAT